MLVAPKFVCLFSFSFMKQSLSSGNHQIIVVQFHKALKDRKRKISKAKTQKKWKRNQRVRGNSNGLGASVEVKKELNLITKHLFSARLESIFYFRRDTVYPSFKRFMPNIQFTRLSFQENHLEPEMQERYMFSQSGLSGNFLPSESLFSHFFNTVEKNPSEDHVDSFSKEGIKIMFWLVECREIAGCLLEVSPYNSLFLCMTFFFQCCSFLCPIISSLADTCSQSVFLSGCILATTSRLADSLSCYPVFCLYSCKAPRPTDSLKFVYLLFLPTKSNKENEFSSIILNVDLQTETSHQWF